MAVIQVDNLTARLGDVLVATPLAAVAFAALAFFVGGGWGIILVEGVAAALIVLLFLRSMNEEGNGDDAG